ncbi:DUF3105 domain-containing protein [Streptomyces sp. cmx-18-6]|uniref:DUF3105 domain-containing protein n=1 Tax=Streptomyces sp. cmx-18-6 TaxID=2790930 RepID=UPI003981592B
MSFDPRDPRDPRGPSAPHDPRYGAHPPYPPQPPHPPQAGGSARSSRARALVLGLGAAVVAAAVGFGTYLMLDTAEARNGAQEKSGEQTGENRAGGSPAQDDKQPGGNGSDTGGAIEGLESWDASELGRKHVAGAVDYPMKPPVGGDHNQSWLNCDGDVYEKAVPDVNAVHSLEHGAVWITYNDRAAAADVAKLAERVRSTPFTLMSPYPGQEGAIMLSAWGKQVTVDSAEDGRVDQFLAQYVQGKQTPEFGAPCTGGLATVPQ